MEDVLFILISRRGLNCSGGQAGVYRLDDKANSVRRAKFGGQAELSMASVAKRDGDVVRLLMAA
jgi:hypothetical protein